MAQADLAWMDSIKDDDKIVGAALNLIHGQTVSYYLGGFDAAYNQMRPGTVLFAEVIERSIAAGHARYDFLRGAEPYKYKWGATDRQNFRLVIYPQSPFTGFVSYAVDGIVAALRGLKRKLMS